MSTPPASSSSTTSTLGLMLGITGRPRVDSTNEQKNAMIYEFFQKPHAISLLVLLCACVATYPFMQDPAASTSSNVKSGLVMAGLVYLMYSMLQPRDVPFSRPHPILWRLVIGVVVLYLMLLVFVVYQNVQDVRYFFTFLDPTLNRPLPEKDYAGHCEFFTPNDPHSYFANIQAVIFDRFILAHFFGWWVKSLVIRDPAACWFLSILFELMEISFSYLLPNFKECWWDSLILDILLCNGCGIYFGQLTLRFLEMKGYTFVALSDIPTTRGKIARVFGQFSPASWVKFRWEVFSSSWRYLAFLFLVCMATLCDLNAFFLKYILWIPYTHEFNIYRMVLWTLIAAMAVRQYYDYLNDKSDRATLGQACWLSIACLLIELLISIKFGKGMFPNPMPTTIFLCWCGGVGLAACILVFLLVRDWRKRPSPPPPPPSPATAHSLGRAR
eukprot:gnl/Hemi2/9864_TR3437_c0_g1_i1.p1 gnl/Hemi2/9864_TR3437_c0_g1~~gnl/Hemi2/9864_TR3437_c0_g1_i1.p1  ORF type:complete len:442 (+),score=111.01 gnl/Hemi2/9864_TR3437_c0_g1_i1:190-1515(+)